MRMSISEGTLMVSVTSLASSAKLEVCEEITRMSKDLICVFKSQTQVTWMLAKLKIMLFKHAIIIAPLIAIMAQSLS